MSKQQFKKYLRQLPLLQPSPSGDFVSVASFGKDVGLDSDNLAFPVEKTVGFHGEGRHDGQLAMQANHLVFLIAGGDAKMLGGAQGALLVIGFGGCDSGSLDALGEISCVCQCLLILLNC